MQFSNMRPLRSNGEAQLLREWGVVWVTIVAALIGMVVLVELAGHYYEKYRDWKKDQSPENPKLTFKEFKTYYNQHPKKWCLYDDCVWINRNPANPQQGVHCEFKTYSEYRKYARWREKKTKAEEAEKQRKERERRVKRLRKALEDVEKENKQ